MLTQRQAWSGATAASTSNIYSYVKRFIRAGSAAV